MQYAYPHAPKLTNKQKSKKKSQLADDEDEDDEDDEDEEIDLFEDVSDGGEDSDAGAADRYEDFFDPPMQPVVCLDDPCASSPPCCLIMLCILSNNQADTKRKSGVTFADEKQDKEDDEEDSEDDEEEGEEDSDDEESGAKQDLFAPSDAEESDSDGEQLSRFEKEQRRVQEQIARLEEFNVSDKPWQLKGGASALFPAPPPAPQLPPILLLTSIFPPLLSEPAEIDSRARPLNSLLEEDLDYEHTVRPGWSSYDCS